jgi:gliding motility-associated-like protein
LVTIPTNGELHFQTRSFTSGNQGTLYQIRVAPATATQTNPAAYTLVQQWTETELTAVYNVCEEKIVDLSAYAGQQIYVSFVMVFTQPTDSLGGDRWLVDAVSINQKCLVPTGLTAAGLTFNGANLNWANPSGATSWEIEIIPVAATPTGAGVIYSGPLPYPVTGLLPNTTYKYYVRALCSTGYTSAWSAVSPNFTTSTAPPVCGGNFIDSGGTTGNYTNNSNNTTTICPVTSGQVVTVTFTAFSVQNGFDFLNVYNGSDATAPLLASLTGTTLPPSITSSATNGCLTFVFTSNASVTATGWASNVTCAPPPTCQQPIVLTTSSITPTSATFGWTNVGSATSWQVLALPCGSPAPTAATTGWFATATNSYNFTGLTSASCYNLYVRGVCSPTDNSAWSGPTVLNTPVAPPVCGGNYVDAAGPTTNYANNSDSTVTICPTIAGQQVTVTFTAFNIEANWDALYVFDGNSITSPQIASTNPAANVPGGLAGGFWGTVIPGPFTSSSPDGCLTFRFRSDGSITNPGWIANVTCAPPPTCQQPTALVTSALTFNSVTLGWTNVGLATSWQVLVLPCGSPAPTEASTGWTATTTNPFVITGLSSATCYNLYVRGDCSSTSNGVSLWSGPRTITTLVAPPVCGGNFVDAAGPSANYANNSNVTTTICPTNPGEIVTVTFTSFSTEANWDGLYVYDGNAVNPATLIASTNPAGNVPGGLAGSYWGNTIPGPFTSTTADGCLTFVFRSDGSVTQAGWIANITCSPAPTCARPTLLTATNITQTSALLTWTQPLNPDGSQATAWEILVLPAGSPIPTTNGIPATSPYLATGLSPGTAYVFYVRAICTPTDSSIWSALNFAALPTNDECTNAIFAVVNQNLNCVQTTPGTLSGATGSLPTTTCPGVVNDDVWFTFTATAVTHIISFNNVLPATVLNYAIFQGTDCGSLTQVGCNSGANLIPGTTYFIRVYSTSALPQFTNFNLCIGTLPCVEAPAFCTGQTVTYANSTNIPSLGQIGCLFTSPNPAFFFLQVNQAGPLSYLISQVDTNGVPRDVDYVAWGPFSDLTTACSGVPANPLPGLIPALTPAGGCQGTLHACSYSAAPTEIMCIPNAQLCQVYVIMITNFSNQPGTVTFTQTNAGGGTTECFPINTFNYPQTYYCQDGTNPTPVLAAGASAGTYTSTTGLVIDSVTGTINLAASTPGPYIITSTTLTSTGGVCTNIPSIITTRTVIITAAANATISYPSATYCNNITTSQSITQTGTSTGTYTASPSGLLINQNTGEILPIASTPGVYTVTYTIQAFGGCAAFVTTTPVEILSTPNVPQQAPVTVCDSYILPALSVGNYFTGSGGTGNPLIAGEVITTTQTIYVFAQNATCSDEEVLSITINSVPTPTFNITQPTCQVQIGTIEVTAPVSASYEYNIDGGTYQTSTTFANLAPATYSIIVHDVVTGCFSTPISITINPVPLNPTVTTFSYTSPVCQDATSNPTPNTSASGFTIGGTYSSTPGLSIDSATGIINLVASTPGIYTVTYSVNADPSICLEAGSSTSDITINAVITPVTTFNYTSPVCDGSADPLPNPTGFTTGGIFTSTTGLSLNSATGEINLSTSIPGTYTVTYTIDAIPSSCQLSSTSTAVIVISNPVEIIVTGECVGVNYIVTANPVGTSFDPSNVSYSWENSTGLSIGDTQSITVTEEETYTVTVVSNGCNGIASFTVDAITCVIQKGISPNGDDLNDTFDLRGLNVRNLGIFNRFGTKVYSRKNYTDQWGGQTDKGEELPDGTYYFVIERDNGETKTGWIYINREI